MCLACVVLQCAASNLPRLLAIARTALTCASIASEEQERRLEVSISKLRDHTSTGPSRVQGMHTHKQDKRN